MQVQCIVLWREHNIYILGRRETSNTYHTGQRTEQTLFQRWTSKVHQKVFLGLEDCLQFPVFFFLWWKILSLCRWISPELGLGFEGRHRSYSLSLRCPATADPSVGWWPRLSKRSVLLLCWHLLEEHSDFLVCIVWLSGPFCLRPIQFCHAGGRDGISWCKALSYWDCSS